MKLFFTRVLLLLLLFIVFTSYSYANISFTRMQEIDYSGTKWDMFNYCIEQCCKKSLDEVLQETTSQSDLTNFSTLFSYLESNDYISVDYVLEYSSNNTGSAPNQLVVKLSKSNFIRDYVTFTIYKLKTKTTWWVSKTGPNNSSLGVGSTTIQTNGARAEFLYNVQNGTTKWYKNTNNQVDPPRYILEFSPYLVGTQTISGINFNLIKLNRDTPSIILGNMIGYQHFDNIEILQYKYNNDKSLSFNTYLTYLDDGGVVQNTLYALFNQGYALKFTYDGEETGYYNIYFVSPDFSSGDTISGDLYYGGNQNNNNIDLLQQNQENQDFWVKTYNDMFSLSSGDVSEIVTMVESYFPSGDTPLSVYDMIFGSVNNEPDDFIIRWDDISMFFTTGGGNNSISGDFIHANSINFSKLCRDNATFGLVQFWIRILSTIAFYILFVFSFYQCILVIFGVYSGVVSPPVEEQRQIGFINDWRDK